MLKNYGFNFHVDGIEVEEFSSWSGKSSIFKPILSLISAIHSEPSEAGHAEANSIFVEFSRELSISFPKSRTESNEG